MLVAFAFRLINLSRAQKRLVQVFFDAICAGLSYLLAFGLLPVLGLLPPTVFGPSSLGLLMLHALVFALGVVTASYFLGLYRAVVRYAGIRVLQAVFASSCLAGAVVWLFSVALGYSLHVLILIAVIGASTALMSGARLILREAFYLLRKADKPNVVLYGAGDAGRQLLTSFAQSASHRVVALMDDSRELQGTEVHGVRIHPPEALEYLKERFDVQAVILAAPSISRQRKNEILKLLEPLGLPLKSLPSVSDILAGRKSVADLQQVLIEDVLGRDPVTPNRTLLGKKVTGRSVLVTGGGGSIGRELCLRIADLKPARLVILDSSEFALYSVLTDLQDRSQPNAGHQTPLVPVLSSVLNQGELVNVLQENRVQTVFHAAAFKHVPLVEANPFAGLQNNVFGTLSVLEACEATGVSDFVLISTDKAVRPTNVMGASKRIAELVAQAKAAAQPTLCVSMVRFGNVLSSSGSVIPRFKDQIAAGGPVTVTHPDITRFFMTMPEAVDLVLQASGIARGGEVFLLEMGEPVRILDLAKRMIWLSGFRPTVSEGASFTSKPSSAKTETSQGLHHDISIVFSGLRPGEKLYEELLIDANAQPTPHPKIYMATEPCPNWDHLQACLTRLRDGISSKRMDQVVTVFEELGVGYEAKV